MERLLAIFHAITDEEVRGGTAEVLTQFATLVALRLVGPAGAGAQDVLDPGTKWRCKVGEEFVRGVCRGWGWCGMSMSLSNMVESTGQEGWKEGLVKRERAKFGIGFDC